MDWKDFVVWLVGIAAGTAVLLSPAACTMERQRRVMEAIQGGADPIAAKCAIESDLTYTPACVIAAGRGR